MELNNINNKGNWGSAAASLNDNFAKVNAEVEKVKSSTVRFKGFFTSFAGLSSACPTPGVGDTAWVGDTYPGMVYECKSAGVWANTNKAPITPSVQLADYAKTELLDKRTTEYNVSVQHPSSGIDGTNKFTLALAIALVPSPLRTVGIKCSFLNDAGTVETWEYQGGAFADTSSWAQGGARKVAELESEMIANRYNSTKINSENLLNPNDPDKLIGKYINSANGNLEYSPNYEAIRYIAVQMNTPYSFVFNYPNGGINRFAFYDKNFVFISGNDITETTNVTTPDQAAYLSVSVATNSLFLWAIIKGVNMLFKEFTYNVNQFINHVSLDKMTDMINIVEQESKISNIVNPGTFTDGKYINSGNGTLADNPNYNATDFISVIPGKVYRTVNMVNRLSAFYDADKKFIIGNSEETDEISTPANCYFFRTCATNSTSKQDTALYNSNKIPANFIHYADKYKFDWLFSNGIVQEKNSSFLITNLVIIEEVEEGKYIAGTTGNTQSNTAYKASGFIPVVPGRIYKSSLSTRLWAYYDYNKNFFYGGEGAGGEITTDTFIIPDGAYYVRTTNLISSRFTFVDATNGVNKIIPEDGKYVIPESFFGTIPDNILIFLPAEIKIAVGRTIELYNEQVAWCGNIENYHFQWVCEIGKPLKRKFSTTGVSTIEKMLTLRVYDNNMNMITAAATMLKVVPNTIHNEVKLLNIGDSIANNKPWLQELRTLSGDRITMVGTRGAGVLKHEGRSGWTANEYLKPTAYSYEGEGVHPFWNSENQRFDWNYYKRTTGINPDVIQINLGTNGMQINPVVATDNLKQIIDYIRKDDANIPILIDLIHYWGNQDALGVTISSDGFQSLPGYWDLEQKRKVFNLCDSYYNAFKNYNKISFVPLNLTMDRENNYKAVETPVNPRSTYTEAMPKDSVHPENPGYMQFADIMLGYLVG